MRNVSLVGMFRKFLAKLLNRPAEETVVGQKLIRMLALDGFTKEFAPGAFDDEATGGNIPKTDAPFGVGVKPARGNINHGKGGGAHQPDFADAVDQPIKKRQHEIESGSVLGESEGYDGF